MTPTGITHHYGGIMGILGAAGVVFFAFIGFDAVSTTAQEAKNPKRDMPIGILGSLAICTVLYVLFSYVLSGIATVQDFRTAGREASVAYAITKYMPGYAWLSNFVTFAILAGFSSVILVMLLGQSRVFYSMSHDGLVPKVFSEVHPRFKTPYKSNWLFFFFTAIFAAFLPEDIVGEMTSIGTLFAFILVCIGVWIMRVKRPDIPRAFKAPVLPVTAILGIVVCLSMIYGLGWTNWARLIVWLLIGFIIGQVATRRGRVPLSALPTGRLPSRPVLFPAQGQHGHLRRRADAEGRGSPPILPQKDSAKKRPRHLGGVLEEGGLERRLSWLVFRLHPSIRSTGLKCLGGDPTFPADGITSGQPSYKRRMWLRETDFF